MAAFGLTAAGEFSNAVTDCGLYVNGVNLGTRYEGTYPGNPSRVGSCDPWIDWQTWDQSMKDSIKAFAMSSMDALQVCGLSLIVLVPRTDVAPYRTGSSGHGKLAIPRVV